MQIGEDGRGEGGGGGGGGGGENSGSCKGVGGVGGVGGAIFSRGRGRGRRSVQQTRVAVGYSRSVRRRLPIMDQLLSSSSTAACVGRVSEGASLTVTRCQSVSQAVISRSRPALTPPPRAILAASRGNPLHLVTVRKLQL